MFLMVNLKKITIVKNEHSQLKIKYVLQEFSKENKGIFSISNTSTKAKKVTFIHLITFCMKDVIWRIMHAGFVRKTLKL